MTLFWIYLSHMTRADDCILRQQKFAYVYLVPPECDDNSDANKLQTIIKMTPLGI